MTLCHAHIYFSESMKMVFKTFVENDKWVICLL